MSGTWASGWINGDVVTAAEFAKGAGLIADSTLGADAASIDLTGLPTSYGHLLVFCYLRGSAAVTQNNVGLRFNNDSGANYDDQELKGVFTAATALDAIAGSSIVVGVSPGTSAPANVFSGIVFFVPHYANAVNHKNVIGVAMGKSANAAGGMDVRVKAGAWRATAAINRITLFPATGNFVTGSRVSVYALGD